MKGTETRYADRTFISVDVTRHDIYSDRWTLKAETSDKEP